MVTMYGGGASAVSSDNITDGAIVNADINAAAGIVRTKLDNNVFQKTYGIATRALDGANGVQNIAHGLGRIPFRVKLSVARGDYGQNIVVSNGVSDGTNQRCVFSYQVGTEGGSSTAFAIGVGNDDQSPTDKGQTGVVTMDATNIIITWTKGGAPTSSTFAILWEAE